MSEDKEQRTEEATPRRRKKARDEGQVGRSQDLSAMATFVGGMAALLFFGVTLSRLIADYTIDVLGHLDSSAPFLWIDDMMSVLCWVVLPSSFAAMVGALAAGFVQVGWNPTFKPLKPDPKKLNPLKKLKQMFFSTNSIVEVLKALAKIFIIGAIVGGIIYRQIVGSASMTAASAGQSLERIGAMSVEIGWRAAIAMFLLALLDYAWQRRQFEQSIKMTKHEIKEEYKEMEGDPHIKGKRRQKMRELAGRRAQAVSEAAVVVVNPTHVAVALRYTPPDDAAPTVIAKGIDEGALRVREEARRHNVPIHHDPPLARKLARKVPTGKTITPDLYRAVAAVLAAVLQAQHRGRAS